MEKLRQPMFLMVFCASVRPSKKNEFTIPVQIQD